MSITIEWLGHCAFRLKGSDGLSILIDPFDETIGYSLPPYDCDILLISHNHYDSSATHLVPPGYELVSNKGTTLTEGIAFNALPLWHDKAEGQDFGSVLIFLFNLDGFRIGYLSHIGMMPPGWMIDKIGKLDICFIPTGGDLTIGPSEARQLVDRISPGFVIPMHFKTRHLKFTLQPVTDFTKGMEGIRKIDHWAVEINRDEIPDTPTILLLRYWPGNSPI